MKPKYLIDPGHGDKDSGAVSKDGKTSEKDIVLDVGLKLYELMALDGRFDVFITRHDDSFLSLKDRVSMADSLGANIVSIHANAGGGRGYEVFTYHGQTNSDNLATSIIEKYGKRVPEFITRVDLSDGDPDKEAGFTVLTNKKLSVLVELGFMDSDDINILRSENFRSRAAKGIYEGIVAYEFAEEEVEDNFQRSTIEAVILDLEKSINRLRSLLIDDRGN